MKTLLYVTAAFVVGCMVSGIFFSARRTSESVTVATRDTVYDTIPYPLPVPRDSVVIRYEVSCLPLAAAPADTTAEAADSAAVLVPITQKEYEDSTYHAWVSGYDVNLDSIHVYSRHEYTTETLPPVKPKRWHLGIGAGVAVTPRGLQPYIGAGITYSFKSF